MILDLPNPQRAAQWCIAQRAAGRTLGFVPTMGALHEGHLSLVRHAVSRNDATCASIFVNPLQFNDTGDFERYPRDHAFDKQLLQDEGCDMVFTGTLTQFFPNASNFKDIKTLDPGKFAQGLEGDYRPRHFAGVCTIVERLFKTVGYCTAYFGEKDFQQTLVVKDLARTMGYPGINIRPTIREQDGLALSSRNVLLTAQDRTRAVCLYNALMAAKKSWRQGERDAERLRSVMREILVEADVKIDYADVRDPEHWQTHSPNGKMERARALIAVHLGKVRLIDNMQLNQ